VKRQDKVYDMDFGLDTTKAKINRSLKIPKGLSESVNRRSTDNHNISVKIHIHIPDRQFNTRESRDNKIHIQDRQSK
jgi:hypothetical protein